MDYCKLDSEEIMALDKLGDTLGILRLSNLFAKHAQILSVRNIMSDKNPLKTPNTVIARTSDPKGNEQESVVMTALLLFPDDRQRLLLLQFEVKRAALHINQMCHPTLMTITFNKARRDQDFKDVEVTTKLTSRDGKIILPNSEDKLIQNLVDRALKTPGQLPHVMLNKDQMLTLR